MAQERSLVVLGALACAALVVLCGLGAWQLARLDEKTAFLDRLKAQAAAAPAPLPAPERWAALDLDAADLTRVRLAGTWVPGATATVRVVMGDGRGSGMGPASPPPSPPAPGAQPQSFGGFGRYMIAALRLDGGQVVLVNRGFAPEPLVASLPPPSGAAEITGFIRKPERGNAFTPAGDAGRRDFHARDPAAIAAALSIAAAPFMIEAERTGPAPPLGVEAEALLGRISNNHLQYAMTWFGLALTLAAMFAVYARNVRKGGAEAASSL